MSFSVEFESPVAAARMFKAAVLDWHNLGPKIAPEIIVSSTEVEGTGGVGSIRQINFTSVMPFSFAKERLDFLDLGKLECKSTVLEGGHVGTKLESASAHFKFEPTSSGGSVCKVVASYKTLAGVDEADDIVKATESLNAQLKAVETYLLANPDAYV